MNNIANLSKPAELRLDWQKRTGTTLDVDGQTVTVRARRGTVWHGANSSRDGWHIESDNDSVSLAVIARDQVQTIPAFVEEDFSFRAWLGIRRKAKPDAIKIIRR